MEDEHERFEKFGDFILNNTPWRAYELWLITVMMFITLIYSAYVWFKLQQLQIGHGSAALIFFAMVLMQLFFQLWRIKKIVNDVQVFHYIHNETDQGDQNKAISKALYGLIDTTFYWCGTVLVQLVLINKLLIGH